MANFDLNSYETVEQRHARAIEAHPDLRSVMVNHTTPADRAQGMWVVEARVYLTAEDQVADLPKATEWAFEIDGQGMANKTSALENAATSSLGRALRWALGGSKGPSREEMAKAQRGQTPKAPPVEWRAEIETATTVETLTAVHTKAVAGGYASPELMSALSARKAVLA
jgi:hypothetical protein